MRGSSTFLYAVVRGIRLYAWKTNPIRSPRMRARRVSSRVDISPPTSSYDPMVGRSRQPRIPRPVRLPEPEGPMIATNSRSLTTKLTPRRASTVTSPAWKTFVTPSSSMTAGPTAWLIDHFLGYERAEGERRSLFLLRCGHLRENDCRSLLEPAHDLDPLVVLEPGFHLDLRLFA